MLQERKYPFKTIGLTITKDYKSNYIYEVFENGRRLCWRSHYSGDFIACLVIKDLNRYPYSIAHLYTALDKIGAKVPAKYPYAIGLKQGVEITKELLMDYSRIGSLFLRR